VTASSSRPRPALTVLAPLALLIGLAGCAAPTVAPTTTPKAPPTAAAAPCTDVTVIVDFGSLKHNPIKTCAKPGTAAEVLKAAQIDTVGTADYGDAVICRVDALPAPDAESCAKLPTSAYWAMWVKPSAGGKWDYAQEGVQTQKLTAGEFLGLVYTAGSDSTPPQG
jgi:hypothetical protein